MTPHEFGKQAASGLAGGLARTAKALAPAATPPPRRVAATPPPVKVVPTTKAVPRTTPPPPPGRRTTPPPPPGRRTTPPPPPGRRPIPQPGAVQPPPRNPATPPVRTQPSPSMEATQTFQRPLGDTQTFQRPAPAAADTQTLPPRPVSYRRGLTPDFLAPPASQMPKPAPQTDLGGGFLTGARDGAIIVGGAGTAFGGSLAAQKLLKNVMGGEQPQQAAQQPEAATAPDPAQVARR